MNEAQCWRTQLEGCWRSLWSTESWRSRPPAGYPHAARGRSEIWHVQFSYVESDSPLEMSYPFAKGTYAFCNVGLMNTKDTEWDVVEGSILPISYRPPVKMEGHPWVNCDSELQLLIAVSADFPEPAPESWWHQRKTLEWNGKSTKSCNLKNAVPI